MKSSKAQEQNLDKLEATFKFLVRPLKEIYFAIKSGATDFFILCLSLFILVWISLLDGDIKLINWFHLERFYPKTLLWRIIIFNSIVVLGFFIYGMYHANLREQLRKRLSQVLVNCGLKNALGKLPSFIWDRPIDEVSRKLRLTNGGFELSKFKAVQDQLEAGLQVYVDEIRQDLESGAVDIIYSHTAMPKKTILENIMAHKNYSFVVGRTRSQEITASFLDCPHLAVAGQSGGGKSSFLRQMITTLYLNNTDARFVFVDLKQGAEASVFQDWPRMTVVSDPEGAAAVLSECDDEMTSRLDIFANNKCKDLETFNKLPNEKRKFPLGMEIFGSLARKIIVVDEAADLFLVTDNKSQSPVQRARKSASRLARLGRAAGYHLVIATQRPDVKSLDPQVKANLIGTVCFQVKNLASSLVILGNGRGCDLPEIPGRALWDFGSSLIEVQCPHLETYEAEKLVSEYLKRPVNSESLT